MLVLIKFSYVHARAAADITVQWQVFQSKLTKTDSAPRISQDVRMCWHMMLAHLQVYSCNTLHRHSLGLEITLLAQSSMDCLVASATGLT